MSTSTRSEVRSPTRTSTSTKAHTSGNFTSTVTGGAGKGATSVTIKIPGGTKKNPRTTDYRTVQYYVNNFQQAIKRYPNTWHGLRGLDPQYKKMRSAVNKLHAQGLIHWRAGRGRHHLEFKAK